MISIKINDREYQVEEGKTILEAAREIGIEIPHYCYHPALSIAGNCRMCLVEVKGMPKPMTACSTRVSEGMEIYTDSEIVKEARKGVLEFILLDHPLDCPICDKSGECRLQDYYFEYSAQKSRYEFPKERHKVEKISKKIYLNPNRCVLCTRCVRFLSEITKTYELTTVERGSHTHIVCVDSEGLDNNPFASNIADLCPVGALGLNEFRFKKRVWFTKKVKAICQGCAAGCNIYVDVSNRKQLLDGDDDEIVRIHTAENRKLGQYFICDEGRYSYKLYNDKENRVKSPVLDGEEVGFEKAVEVLKEKANVRKGVVILSPLHSIEENYAAYLFARERGFDVFRPSSFRKELPEPALFIEEKKSPNDRMLKLMKLPKVSEIEEIDYDFALFLHNVGKVHSKSEVRVLSVLKRATFSVVFEPMLSDFGKSANMVLPAPIFVEENGCYINKKNFVQHSNKALDYMYGAKPIWEFLGMDFKSEEEVFIQFAKEQLDKDLNYQKLGTEGFEL